jgi:hypothetical protein
VLSHPHSVRQVRSHASLHPASCNLANYALVPRLVDFIDSIIETSYGPKTGSRNHNLDKITDFILDSYRNSDHVRKSGSYWESPERQKLHNINTLIKTNYGKRDAAAEKADITKYGLENDD